MTDWVSEFEELISRGVPSFRHALKSVLFRNANLPSGHWFFLEVTPVSEKKDIVAEVLRSLMGNANSFIIVDNGCVTPDEDFTVQYKLSADDKRVVNTIEPKTYRIIFWEGSKDEQIEQLRYPVFFVIEPEINQISFSKHPHLHPALPTKSEILMPPSLCYEYDYASLGDSKYEQMKNAYVRVCIWLFRHQIWELRSGDPLRRWPGKEEETDERLVYRNWYQVLSNKNKWTNTANAMKELFFL